MPDQPYTIRDGGKMWQHVLDGASVWGVTGPMYDDVGMPCLVVTGDLDAARRRLAPLPADTRTTAVDVCRAALALDNARTDGQAVTMRAVIEWCVDALVAAGLIRPAHDDAAIERAARALYVLDGYPAKDWAIETETTKDAYRRPARSALAAAEERDDA